jgi:hypothetical protein
MFLKCPFDYGKLKEQYPSVGQMNPDGSCFTMSCRWARELLDGPTTAADVLRDMLAREIENLAPIHQTYIKETRKDLPQSDRNAGYIKAFRAFHLKSSFLTGGPNDQIPGFSNEKIEDKYTDWMGLTPGDMWGAVYRWSMQQTKPFAAILSDSKHSVGVFIRAESIRIWDMNAGEFLVTGEAQWRMWSSQFEKFETGGTLAKVDLIPIVKQ